MHADVPVLCAGELAGAEEARAASGVRPCQRLDPELESPQALAVTAPGWVCTSAAALCAVRPHPRTAGLQAWRW